MTLNLKYIALCAGLAVGCGGSSHHDGGGIVDFSSKDTSVTGGQDAGDGGGTNPDILSSGTGTIGGTVQAPDTAMSEAAAGGTPNPFENGVTVSIFEDKTLSNVSATVASQDGTWSISNVPTGTVTPYIAGDSTYLPVLSDPEALTTAGLPNIPAHALHSSGMVDVFPTLAAAGGPSQATILTQGACFVDSLQSHDPQPVPEPTSITADTGYDIYHLTWDASGNPSATKTSTSGAMAPGRFIITKNGNTASTSVNLQATDTGGMGYTFPAVKCRIEPGYITFLPYLRNLP